MNSPAPDVSAARSPPGPKIWFGILGAPLAFTFMEGLGWLVSAASCPGGSPAGYGGFPMISNANEILYAVFGAALLTSLGALYVGVTEWRRLREASGRDADITSIEGRLRPEFLAATAMLVSAVFTLAVAWMCIGLFWLPSCEVMR